jgi:hypothetical protein
MPAAGEEKETSPEFCSRKNMCFREQTEASETYSTNLPV